mmetsp:Transcript_5530/g.34217  ORF Transcript_5530/g.34217 Transcript_5530/m.34217 type:complete len:119 (-) Transcript_5530:3005-3361(-)
MQVVSKTSTNKCSSCVREGTLNPLLLFKDGKNWSLCHSGHTLGAKKVEYKPSDECKYNRCGIVRALFLVELVPLYHYGFRYRMSMGSQVQALPSLATLAIGLAKLLAIQIGCFTPIEK